MGRNRGIKKCYAKAPTWMMMRKMILAMTMMLTMMWVLMETMIVKEGGEVGHDYGKDIDKVMVMIELRPDDNAIVPTGLRPYPWSDSENNMAK
jgi:hypothetical protein